MAKAEQKAIAETYRDAAMEHVAVAAQLYDLGRFVLAAYVAGLSVECMLRGYRFRIDPEFDSRHDIEKLFELARFANVVPLANAEEVNAAMGDIVLLWSNNHRFLSAAALRKRWTRQKLFRGIKGDFVKERVRQLVNSATRIVSIGVTQWTTSFRD